jgi:aerobic-type carbon monoxide dehydrogenase small subunit (CoxS/CutS family)
MTDRQPHERDPHGQDGPGSAGAWQPVPGGGDYDPDQTMHVSFAAQLPPEPRPGEDPLSAHGPVGPDYHPDYQGQADPAGEGGPAGHTTDYPGDYADYSGYPGQAPYYGTPVYGRHDTAAEDAYRGHEGSGYAGQDYDPEGYAPHQPGGYGGTQGDPAGYGGHEGGVPDGAAQGGGEPEAGTEPGPDASAARPADAATTWTIPVIRDEGEGDSGEFSVGAFAPPPSWDQAPSPAAPTSSFPAGMFGQGAAAARAAAEAAGTPAEGGSAEPAQDFGHGFPRDFPPPPEQHTGQESGREPAQENGPGTGGGPWAQPYGQDGTEGGPWLPAHAPAADAAWSAFVDDPDSPRDPAPHGPAHPAGEAGHEEPTAVHLPEQRSGDDGGSPAGGDGGFGTGPGSAGEHAGEEAAAAGSEASGLPEEPAEGAEPPHGAEPFAPADSEEGETFGAPAQEEGAGSEGPGDPGDPGTSAADGTLPDPLAEPGADAAGTAADTPDHHGDDSGDDPLAGAAAEPEPEPLPETRSEHPLASYMLRVNGTDRPVTDAWLGESLLYVLRERLGLAGAKDGCEQGECGACSVQVDGRLVASCLVPAATAAGSEVRTVEGLGEGGRPSDVQRALADSGAVQCGFCIPGMAMTVHDLLEGNHRPTDLDIRQALSGNLCRCSGYRGVIEAVRQVVATRAAEDEAAADDHARVPQQGGPGTPGAAG